MKTEFIKPDYLFEVSWEVCNKVGGIYTVIATKSLYLKSEYNRHHIMVGPDVWMDTESNPDFIEDPALYRAWKAQAASEGLRVRIGRWNVPGKPTAILVDFKQFLTRQNEILTRFWKDFGVDSLTGNWDYRESALFGYAAGRVIESFHRFNLESSDKVVAQFHEWMTGTGLLYLKSVNVPIATVFTTHATVIGRCIAGNNLPLYDGLLDYNSDEKARQFNVTSVYDALIETDDKLVVYADIADLQRINGWSDEYVSCLEVMLDEDLRNEADIQDANSEIGTLINAYSSDDEEFVIASSSVSAYPQLFDWLNLIDFNVLFILLLMTIVAGFNMISGLLIMLFESISVIGLLKALGMTDKAISKVFLSSSASVVLKGMALGNGIAFLFCIVQNMTKVLRLDPENYFVSYVPVKIDLGMILAADAISFLLIMVLLLIPCLFISKVDPADTVRVK